MRMHDNNTTCNRSNQNAGFLDTTNTTCNRINQNASLPDTQLLNQSVSSHSRDNKNHLLPKRGTMLKSIPCLESFKCLVKFQWRSYIFSLLSFHVLMNYFVKFQENAATSLDSHCCVIVYCVVWNVRILFGNVFQCQGRILMCPDSCQSQIYVYRERSGKARPPPEAKATCERKLSKRKRCHFQMGSKRQRSKTNSLSCSHSLTVNEP